MDSRPFRSRAMRLVAHRMYATRVDPTVIEIEQGTHGNGVVNGLIRETRVVKGRDIGWAYGRGIFIDFADEPEEGLIRIRQLRRFEAGDNAIHQCLILQQFRRDRGVSFCSKRAVVEA